jgi:hypothetical protein
VPVRGIQLSQARDIVACQRKHLLLVGGEGRRLARCRATASGRRLGKSAKILIRHRAIDTGDSAEMKWRRQDGKGAIPELDGLSNRRQSPIIFTGNDGE